MDFGDFYGNDGLKRRLQAAVVQNKMPHSILISGPAGSGKKTLATLIAAALQCTGSGEKPCRRCNACRKVFSHQHPDVIIADDASKKIVPVSLIREIRADMAIYPNEGNRKIYIFPRAHDMNDAAQNALLKIMEEPPTYGVFLLLTENADKLLPTIRSRCAEWGLSPLPPALLQQLLHRQFPERSDEEIESAQFRSGGYRGQALEMLHSAGALLPQTVAFAQAYTANNRHALLQVLVPMEKLKREQLLPILVQWHMLLEQTLLFQAGLPAAFTECRAIARRRTGAELLRGVQILQRAQELATANVGVGHICGALSVQL